MTSKSTPILFLIALTAAGAAAKERDVLSVLSELRPIGRLAASPGGRWMTYQIHAYATRERSVHVHDLRSGAQFAISGAVDMPSISPDDRTLAFQTARSGTPTLFIRRLADGVEHAVLGVEPAESAMVRWSADGEAIAFLGWPRADRGTQPRVKGAVRVSRSQISDPVGAPEERSDAEADRHPIYRSAFQPPGLFLHLPLRRATFELIFPKEDKAVRTLQFAPVGRNLLVGLWQRTTGRAEAVSRVHQFNLEVFKIALPPELTANVPVSAEDAEKPRPLTVSAHRVATADYFAASPNWSPDGRKVAWLSEGAVASNDVWVQSLVDGQAHAITADLEADPSVADLASPDRKANYRRKAFTVGGNDTASPRWLPDGSAVFAVRHGRELWLADATENGSRLVWTAPDGRIYALLQEPESPRAAMRQREVFIVTSGTKGHAPWTRVVGVDLTSGVPRTIYEGDVQARAAAWAAPSDVLLHVGSASPAQNLLKWPGSILRISTAEPRVDHLVEEPKLAEMAGRTEFLRWPGAKELPDEGGVLVLPAGATRPPPCVVFIYPFTRQNPAMVEYAYAPEGVPLSLLAAGYAVFNAQSGIVRNGRAREQVIEGTARIVEALSRTGLVDMSRLAVLGESFGGYSVNCVVTGPSTFKAAVSISGTSSMVSLYLAPYKTVLGRAELAGTLFNNLQEYVANSPVLFADRVTVPLLLLHGGRDETCPVLEAETMFTALRKLGKPAELAIYPQAGHGVPESIADRADLIPRLLRFLDRHIGPPVDSSGAR